MIFKSIVKDLIKLCKMSKYFKLKILILGKVFFLNYVTYGSQNWVRLKAFVVAVIHLSLFTNNRSAAGDVECNPVNSR